MIKRRNLSLTERVRIKTYLEYDMNASRIAEKLGRHRSTITRELNKWCPKKNYEDYNPQLSDWYSRDGIMICQRGEYKLNNNQKLFKLVIKKLIKRWSPQQISGWLKKHFPNNKSMNISHETIYKYIYSVAKGELKATLIEHLRQGKKARKSKVGIRKSRIRIKDRVSIDDRPEEVESRIVPGHYESDLIIGKDHKSAIGTIVERKSRYLFLVPLKNKTAYEVSKSFSKVFKKLPKELRKTMTHDNGLEMAKHKLFTKETEMQVYFCHPYSSWERGTNENTNGLIRQYWPKGTDFNKISKKEIRKVQKEINERPRKVLEFSTPAELFQDFIYKSA